MVRLSVYQMIGSMITKISIPRGVSLAGSIVHEITRLVAAGKIKPGDKFPPEAELAAQMGIGRSSIREAFRVFQMLGVTEAKPGRGTVLINTAPLFALIDWSEFTSADLLNDIVEARLALEPLIAAMAAKRADAAGIRGIEETIEASRRAIGNEAASIQAALDFHTAVAAAAGNQTLLLTTRLLRSLYFEFDALLASPSRELCDPARRSRRHPHRDPQSRSEGRRRRQREPHATRFQDRSGLSAKSRTSSRRTKNALVPRRQRVALARPEAAPAPVMTTLPLRRRRAWRRPGFQRYRAPVAAALSRRRGASPSCSRRRA